jgi:hypothetical protein
MMDLLHCTEESKVETQGVLRGMKEETQSAKDESFFLSLLMLNKQK